jgi:hypothetical protein
MPEGSRLDDAAAARLERESGQMRAALASVRTLRRLANAVDPNKDVLLVIGKEGRGGSSSKGNMKCSNELLLRIWSDHFLVTLVDEDYTSQTCDKCLGPIRCVGRGFRRKECQSQCKGSSGKRYRFHRDVGSAVLFHLLFEYALDNRGARPPALSAEVRSVQRRSA